EVVALADVPALDLVGDREAVLGPDEGDVIDDEDVRLADAGEILDARLGGERPVAPPVERPGASEGAVPGAAACELDGGAGIDLADEVAAAVAGEMARRAVRRQVGHEQRRWPGAVLGDDPRERHEGLRPGEGGEHAGGDPLPLAADDAVD